MNIQRIEAAWRDLCDAWDTDPTTAQDEFFVVRVRFEDVVREELALPENWLCGIDADDLDSRTIAINNTMVISV